MSENDEDLKPLKKGFFKKVWYSIFKLEKYGEMSAEGVFRAIKYLIKLSLIVAIIISLGTLYQMNDMVKKGENFLNKKIGDFTYKDGILEVSKEQPIRVPSSTFGEIIVDTKVEKEEEINKYLNSMEGNSGIIILKDKALIKGISTSGTITYNYKELLDEMSIKETNKKQVEDYLHGDSMWKIYAFTFFILLVYSLINAFLPILFNAFVLSLFGYLATWFAKIRMRYAAIFNLAAYSLTLSILLHCIYIGINIFTDFNIRYFQIMYIGVAAIYLIAAIFLIKSEFIKKQIEIAKIAKMKKEDNQEENQEENNDENKEKEPKEDNKKDAPDSQKDKKENNKGDEPEGSQA